MIDKIKITKVTENRRHPPFFNFLLDEYPCEECGDHLYGTIFIEFCNSLRYLKLDCRTCAFSASLNQKSIRSVMVNMPIVFKDHAHHTHKLLEDISLQEALERGIELYYCKGEEEK